MPTRRITHALAPTALALLPAAAAQGAYVDAVLADNPLAYYRFSETATPTDSANRTIENIGSAPFDGRVSGSSSTVGDVDLSVSGPVGAGFGSGNSAIGFNGDADGDKLDFVSTPVDHPIYGDGIDLGGSYPFTLEAWFNGSSGTIATLTAGYTGSRYYGFRLNSAGELELEARNGNALSTLSGPGEASTEATSWFRYDSNIDLADDEWHYVAAVFGADTDNADENESGEGGSDATPFRVDLYIDPESDSPVGTVYHNVSLNAPNIFGIGANARSGAVEFFNGTIDEVALYGSALTGDQILSHYNAAIPEPTSLGLLGAGFGLFTLRRRSRREA